MLGKRAIYSTKETAVRLGVSGNFLMNEIRDGKIEGKETGKGIKFSKQKIEDYIKKQRIDYSNQKKPKRND